MPDVFTVFLNKDDDDLKYVWTISVKPYLSKNKQGLKVLSKI